MQAWGDIAQSLLDAAVDSGVQVKRAYVAGGPLFARDCHSIVVYSHTFGVRPLAPRGDFSGGICASVPQLGLTVAYVKDCYPVVKDGGVLPSAQEITDWSVQFLSDVGEVFDAVCGWTPDGADCSQITVADGIPGLSPDGGAAELRFPVTVSLLA